LNPHGHTDSKGKMHKERTMRRCGPKGCFSEKDLYTTYFGSVEFTAIEHELPSIGV
jgi:hypothetical protein